MDSLKKVLMDLMLLEVFGNHLSFLVLMVVYFLPLFY